MNQPRIQCFGFVAAVVLNILATTPIRADELVEHLGPVGPHEPIVTSVGSKRMMAFYEANGGSCALDVIVWERADSAASSPTRFRISLKSEQKFHLDAVDNASLTLQCGEGAQTLAVVPKEFIAAGASRME